MEVVIISLIAFYKFQLVRKTFTRITRTELDNLCYELVLNIYAFNLYGIVTVLPSASHPGRSSDLSEFSVFP